MENKICEAAYNCMDEIDIDLVIVFEKAHCLFRELQEDLFQNVKPETVKYETNYEDLVIKVDIINDYLYKSKGIMKDLSDKLTTALGIN